jgi:hypothetical protein
MLATGFGSKLGSLMWTRLNRELNICSEERSSLPAMELASLLMLLLCLFILGWSETESTSGTSGPTEPVPDEDSCDDQYGVTDGTGTEVVGKKPYMIVGSRQLSV